MPEAKRRTPLKFLRSKLLVLRSWAQGFWALGDWSDLPPCLTYPGVPALASPRGLRRAADREWEAFLWGSV